MATVGLVELVQEMDLRDHTAHPDGPLPPTPPANPVSLKALLSRQSFVSPSAPRPGPVGLAAVAACYSAQLELHSVVTVLSYIAPALEDNSGEQPGTHGTDDSPSGLPWAKRQLTLTADHDVTLGSGNDHEHWAKGQFIDADAATSWIAESGSLFNQYVRLAGQILAAISTAVETVELDVAEVIAGAVAEIGVHVDPSVIEAGVKLALAAAGIPPTVPNLAQIYAQGIDYLAATVADTVIEQISGQGIPLPPGAEEATQNAARKGLAAAASLVTSCPQPGRPNCGVDPGNPWTWGVPTPYFLAHPAIMWLKVNVSPSGAPPITSVTIDTRHSFQTTTQPVPTGHGPGLIIPATLWPFLPGSSGVGHVYADENLDMRAWSKQFFHDDLQGDTVTYPWSEYGSGQPAYPTFDLLPVIVFADAPHVSGDGSTYTLHIRTGLPGDARVPLGGVWPPYDGPITTGPQNYTYYYGAVPLPSMAPGPPQG